MLTCYLEDSDLIRPIHKELVNVVAKAVAVLTNRKTAIMHCKSKLNTDLSVYVSIIIGSRLVQG